VLPLCAAVIASSIPLSFCTGSHALWRGCLEHPQGQLRLWPAGAEPGHRCAAGICRMNSSTRAAAPVVLADPAGTCRHLQTSCV
jgi:hypothetical protein